jgi:hypothetical protein
MKQLLKTLHVVVASLPAMRVSAINALTETTADMMSNGLRRTAFERAIESLK